MVRNLFDNNGEQVVLVAELTEHGACGAPSCILEIDGVGHVDDYRQTVDDKKNPPCRILPNWMFLNRPRKEHKQGIERIGVEYGRGVEK